MTKNEKFLAGLVAGVVAGGVAAMLLAPKTGKDTRRVVGGCTNAAARRAGHYVGAVKNRIRRNRGGEERSDVPASSDSENGAAQNPTTENYAEQLG